MKKAVNQWCFPQEASLETIFHIAHEAGLDGVELNIYEPGGVGLTMETTPHEAQSIKKQAFNFGLELHSISNGLLWKWPLSSSDTETRLKGASIVRKQLELASALEINAILVVPGVVTETTSYEQCWERSQNEISELLPYAEKLGVRIGIENVWNKFLLSPVEMLRYVQQFNSSSIGVYFDVGNVLNFGFPQQWIQYLSGNIVKVHVKDFNLRVGNIQGFVPLLSGDVDWKAVRSSLQQVGYDDYITAEVSPYTVDPHQMIYDASAQMSAIINLH